MASSSSSHQQNQRFNAFSGIEPDGRRRMVSESSKLCDVFINHRGPDVKQTLATQLYNSLEEVGIRVFLDSEEKELGQSFPSTIETAIKSAKVHIAIFSKRYAESAWCLAELVLMSQTKAKIIPLFYQVQPWELRFIEKGEYGKAFSKYEKEKRYLEKLPEWKEALQSMSFVAGDEFNGDCKNIIAAVQKEVQKKTCLHVATYPVGLDKLVQDFQRRCLKELVLDFENQCGLKEGKCAVRVVGIFGMGGSGKTTLAKELFNRKSSNYSRASFLFDVREASGTGRLPSLQGKLLKDLFHNHNLNPTNTEEGMSYLKDHLQRSPDLSSLIVVDDIDHADQLNALMIMDIVDKFCNTLIIVTTRDERVLTRAGITDGYNLKGMNRNNGRELFCWNAFKQPHSSNGYERLVEAFVDVCGGLPLSLQVLGRHVHGKPDSFWSSALIQARKRLPQDVKHKLKISFDSLSGEEKHIFMDIACFFIRMPKDIAERVWEGSGWNAQHSLEILKDKCLVEETKIWPLYKPELRMHDHLRDLGREVASELSSPLRLWRPQDLQYLESMGLKNILAEKDLRCFHSMVDKSMNCRVTFFLGQPDICIERSSVLWLDLESLRKFRGIPSWMSLRYVQCLNIQRVQLKTLWKNRKQAPSQLKKLQTGFCDDLEEQSLAPLSCLQGIAIENCIHLKSVPEINNLTKLKQLHVNVCPKLKQLSLGHLSCLEKISIGECSQLESVSGINDLPKLVVLQIYGCGKVEFEWLRLSGMRCLEMIIFDRNVMVKHFEVDNCQNLKSINYGCQNMARYGSPNSLVFENPVCLVRVIINGCGEFECLRLLDCQNLKTMLMGNLEIRELKVRDCPEIEELPTFSSLSSMEKIHIASCRELENIVLPTSLTSLSLIGCKNLRRVSTTGDLKMLTEFYIKDCPEVEELPNFSRLSSIKRIHIASCRKLEKVVLPTRLFLKELVIESSEKLQNMANIEELHVEEHMRLFICSNAVIRNCIDKLKNVPEKSIVIGRAVDGAESGLNEYLFSDAHTVSDFVICDEHMDYYVNYLMRYTKWEGLIPILCCAVLVEDLVLDNYSSLLPRGEWIITTIGIDVITTLASIFQRHGLRRKGRGIMKEEYWLRKRGFLIEYRQDEEWTTRKTLQKIVSLYCS